MITNDGGDTELALGLALDNIAARPIAVLSNGTYHASPGREVHFDASGSSASSSLIEEYRWDLDGDGFSDEVTAGPTINHAYPAGYSGLMQVFVVDDLGRTANASATVLVDEEAAVTVSPVVPTATRMDADAQRDDDHVLLDVSWDPGAEEPERWVIALDGDPVVTADGDAEHAAVPVDQQPEAWTISLVPMDADGNYGASFDAVLDPSPRPGRGTGGWRSGARRCWPGCWVQPAPGGWCAAGGAGRSSGRGWRRDHVLRTVRARTTPNASFCKDCGAPVRPAPVATRPLPSPIPSASARRRLTAAVVVTCGVVAALVTGWAVHLIPVGPSEAHGVGIAKPRTGWTREKRTRCRRPARRRWTRTAP